MRTVPLYARQSLDDIILLKLKNLLNKCLNYINIKV
jgi:hypothetical protein